MLCPLSMLAPLQVVRVGADAGATGCSAHDVTGSTRTTLLDVHGCPQDGYTFVSALAAAEVIMLVVDAKEGVQA